MFRTWGVLKTFMKALLNLIVYICSLFHALVILSLTDSL